MKHTLIKLLAAGLACVALGQANATPMRAIPADLPSAHTAQAPGHAAANPWPALASNRAIQATPLLAHNDRYWHDGRWHYHSDDRRREQWRRAQWHREQARREAERRRDWERHHSRAHRHDGDHRHYRR
ncbi:MULTISPECIES: hypothetical protein [unclassified Pseudomonas]|uniref:hypothetical protein n=1 Tax=unclassified Pseudomonas TaxID=196821 RepID=UPI0011A745BD|nr:MULTISPECIES: hypothetical protein [unclassified Pseudomonas]